MKRTKCFSIESVMGAVASVALLIGVSSVSQACFLAFNQPKVPEKISKFTKNR